MLRARPGAKYLAEKTLGSSLSPLQPIYTARHDATGRSGVMSASGGLWTRQLFWMCSDSRILSPIQECYELLFTYGLLGCYDLVGRRLRSSVTDERSRL